MRALVLYEDYSRQEVQQIFDPDSKFVPQAGTWGLHGIIKIPRRRGDYVFFVTFGRQQADHQFDEGITSDGVLRWQSQPKQALTDPDIETLIGHNEDKQAAAETHSSVLERGSDGERTGQPERGRHSARRSAFATAQQSRAR